MLPPTHPACLPDDLLRKQCRLERLKRSGPGGQRRNKVETAVRLVHEPSGIVAEASERRSAEQNLSVALRRLRVRLALEVRSTEEYDRPSPLWTSRARSGRLVINPDHEDFPKLLMECLDALAATDWNVQATAESLQVSTSQLLQFLRKEPAALRQLNDRRITAGLRALN